MASTQELKTRIRSVTSTKQITKAMQLVAASKMRRAQEATKASAPYTLAARQLLTNLSTHAVVKSHPLFAKRDVRSRLLIVVSSDRGLAGAYNSNVLRHYTQELQQSESDGVRVQTIAVGRKASQFVSRLKDINVAGSYQELSDRPGGNELRAILNTARDMFVSKEVDAVDIVYADFINSVRQEPITRRVLPAGFKPTAEADKEEEILYEPSPRKVLDGIAFRLIGAQVYQALLDARASEHSMRMLAMKNATDNASDLIDDLTLAMNKARQGAITQELAEISGGVEALDE